MTIHGTIINGSVHLDTPTTLPDGTRVELRPVQSYESPLPPTDTEGEHILALRQSIAEMNAGILGTSLAEFAQEMEREFGHAD